MGGIIGYAEQYLVMDSCSVNNCTFGSTVTSTAGWGAIGKPVENNVVGGLVGEARNKIRITDSYVDGEFTVDNGWNGKSHLYVGGIVGMISNVRVSGKIYEVKISNCLTDFTVSQANDSSKRYVSAAVGAYGANTSVSDVYNHSDKLFTVSDSYTMGSGVWDGVVEDFTKESIYTDDFVYNILGFDPMMWSVIEGTIVKKDI
jgi:hypothetical protein